MRRDLQRPAGEPVAIAAGIVLRGDRVLVTRRPPGVHLEGLWEFPGGKLGPGEQPADALRREIAEEIGLEVRRATLFHRQEHDYADRAVDLWFFLVTGFEGEPRAVENQDVAWAAIPELGERFPMPGGNREVIALLQAAFAD